METEKQPQSPRLCCADVQNRTWAVTEGCPDNGRGRRTRNFPFSPLKADKLLVTRINQVFTLTVPLQQGWNIHSRFPHHVQTDPLPYTWKGIGSHALLSKTARDKQVINTELNYCYCSVSVDLCFRGMSARWGRLRTERWRRGWTESVKKNLLALFPGDYTPTSPGIIAAIKVLLYNCFSVLDPYNGNRWGARERFKKLNKG